MIDNKKFGLIGLTAIVFGSMIGSGLFNIVENMAIGASVGAVILSWIITAAGMLCLVATFKILNTERPDLDAGIYQYAQQGFGDYVGFNVAWGYWLCTAFANVAYAVMLNDALGVFIPSLLEHRLESGIFGTCLIWLMYFIVVNGIRGASIINIAITSLKILSIVLIVVLLCISFRTGVFITDFWGTESGLGGLGVQVRNTMLVTLWCFIGIEGAVVMSARARRASDVGKASILGFLLAWVLYVLVSVLAYGVMSQAQMAGLGNPSVAYLLKDAVGEWAYYFVIIAVICSLLGGWVAWTLICAQVPYEAAEHGVMPRQFLHLNRRGVPSYGLLLASVIMNLFYIGVLFAEGVYMATIEISGMMILPAYLFSGIFLVKATYKKEKMLHMATDRSVTAYRIVGILCSIYCLWLIYAGGLELMLLTSLFYLPGVYFYARARHKGRPIFDAKERWVFIALCCLAVISLFVLGMI